MYFCSGQRVVFNMQVPFTRMCVCVCVCVCVRAFVCVCHWRHYLDWKGEPCIIVGFLSGSPFLFTCLTLCHQLIPSILNLLRSQFHHQKLASGINLAYLRSPALLHTPKAIGPVPV